MMNSTRPSTPGDDALGLLPRPEQKATILVNVLIPTDAESNKYSRQDVLLRDGKIAEIAPANTIATSSLLLPENDFEVLDCTEKMLLPGFVNAHTHSSEHWAHGLIQPLPLELWVLEQIRHDPRGPRGWYGDESFEKTPAWSMGVSALHCGVESILSGCTAIMDHLYVRNIDDIGAAVNAYKALGIRAFVAPMLSDDAVLFSNYIPLVHDATERNANCKCCGGMGSDGSFRLSKGDYDAAKTQAALELWEEAIDKYHDPANGIEIVIGPVTVYSCSPELLQGAARLRKKYNLCGHTHVLETRAQALMAKQYFPSQSAVKHLRDMGFLDKNLRGTSFAHTVWLTDEEFEIAAEHGATCVHNPLSNLRLGSGVMPVDSCLKSGVKVAMGCDGSCSSDGQDMLEALKLGTIVSAIAKPDYREWLTARQVALTLASKNGYGGLGMEGQAGEIKVGMVADLTLWDLTSLAMLPRTDPLQLLILGSRTQAPGAGSTLHSSWVRGNRVVADGSPTGLNLPRFREFLMKAQPVYRDPSITDPNTDCELTAAAEVEYRASMGLEQEGRTAPTPTDIGTFPQNRVCYDSTIE